MDSLVIGSFTDGVVIGLCRVGERIYGSPSKDERFLTKHTGGGFWFFCTKVASSFACYFS